MSATTLSEPKATTQSTISPAIQAWRVVLGALAATAIVMSLVYLAGAFSFRATPFLGAFITNTGVVNAARPTGQLSWPGIEAGINNRDRIIAVNGDPVVTDGNFSQARENIYNAISAIGMDETVTLDIERLTADPDGVCNAPTVYGATCSIDVRLSQLPGIDFLTYFILPYGAGLLMIGLGLLVLRYRSEQKIGLLAAAGALLSAIFATGIFDVGTTGLLTPVWLMSAIWLGGVLITMSALFPRRLRWLRTVPILQYVPLIVTTVLGGFFVAGYLNPATAYETEWPQNATTISALSLIFSMGLIAIQRQRASNPVSRDQSNSIFIGFSLMLLPAIFWFLARVFASQAQVELIFNFETLIPLYIFPNAAIANAVLQYRRFDTDRVISGSITYSIMLGAVIVAVYLIVLGASLIALDLMNSSAEIVPVSLILFVLVAVISPIRTRLQDRIDALYFRKRRDLQGEIESFSTRLPTLDTYEEIVRTFIQTLDDAIAPTNVFIFLRNRYNDEYVAYSQGATSTDIRFMADSQLVQMLSEAPSNEKTISLQPGEPWPYSLISEQPRLQLLKTRVIVGMPGREFLNGFVLIGPARDGKATYNFEDVHFMEGLIGQFAIATERSQAMESLEQRVRQLDVLSQVGQAVNFTVEYDDLLELIYAQTSRLVSARYFYIALYDQRLEKMYFAFFLEDDERLENRENVYWELGRDIFSDVVSTSKYLKLDDYKAGLREHSVDGALISDELQTLIAMPLSVGRDNIGVIAAGKTEANAPYNDEQFKIFTDLGSLAATSLDKANLFEQTRVRERQLTVLNDISRQLVATETDVESLLQIIINSAVEILDAEAGSLLLNAEDDSGDLIFRVVAGGGGNQLVGKRLPKGEGIVGEVVKTGQSSIVNDAESDQRHAAEVTADFISKSLLTVPLVAQNDVIGVIQILNKKDGTIFFRDDAELLTTFAAQAAVAIENARLFELTDQQLAARVRDLEVLERLDAELNRTRELTQVAKITVDTAMNVLQANAGALGIVHQEHNILEIVAIEGYSQDEYPDGASGEDLLDWPLMQGIVGRVVRSRTPDFQRELNLDNDYTKGLTGSNSQLTIPMISSNDVNAVLILEKNEEPPFSLPQWAFAQRIAEHASLAIENAQFFAELERANKGTSQFMGFAAHELKNPLASVKGYANVLASGMTGELSEQQANFLNVIETNAARMERIISDLRDAAKIGANEFDVQPVPLNIRHAVIETLRPYARILEEKNQELVNNVPEDLPMVLGDETRLIQVFTNFISNAHKYSHSDTTITVTGQYVPDFVTEDGKSRGPMVQISVADQGFGMSEEDRSKLFQELYFRSSNQEARDKEGTGLGMVLTKTIIDKHAGEIWVESELGVGSTFHIAIPIAPEDLTKTQARRPKSMEPASD